MCRRGRMRREGTDVSDVHESGKQLQRVEKTSAALPCFSARSLQAKGEKARSLAREILLDQRMVCVLRKPGVVHPGDLWVLFEILRNLQGALADSVHAKRQGFNPLKDQEGIEG